jgi:hypothetical protein
LKHPDLLKVDFRFAKMTNFGVGVPEGLFDVRSVGQNDLIRFDVRPVARKAYFCFGIRKD